MPERAGMMTGGSLGPAVNSRRERGIELQLGFAACGPVVSGGLVA
jgi:hypothetical protein